MAFLLKQEIMDAMAGIVSFQEMERKIQEMEKKSMESSERTDRILDQVDDLLDRIEKYRKYLDSMNDTLTKIIGARVLL